MAKHSRQQTSSDEAMSSEEEPINEQFNEEEDEEELEAVARSADSDDDEAAGDAEGDGGQGNEADEVVLRSCHWKWLKVCMCVDLVRVLVFQGIYGGRVRFSISLF